MLKKQYIALLFASLLLVNLAHNIIPHHHHLDAAISHQCCPEHNDLNVFEKNDPVSHCHSYNGMDYFPFTDKYKLDKPSGSATDIHITGHIQDDFSYSYERSQHDSRGSPSFKSSAFGSSLGLRAPPRTI